MGFQRVGPAGPALWSLGDGVQGKGESKRPSPGAFWGCLKGPSFQKEGPFKKVLGENIVVIKRNYENKQLKEKGDAV